MNVPLFGRSFLKNIENWNNEEMCLAEEEMNFVHILSLFSFILVILNLKNLHYP